MSRNRFLWRILNHFLEYQVHKQKQRLGFHDQDDRLTVLVIGKVLVYTAIFYN